MGAERYTPSLVESLLRRDRTVSIIALFVIVALSWAYVLNGAGMDMSAFDMSSLQMALGQSAQGPISVANGSMGSVGGAGITGGAMSGTMQAMATPVGWTAGYAVVMFFMWWIMMIAMMLPSAAPTVLLYGAVNRKAQEKGGQSAVSWNTGAFTTGYLIAWAAFSLVAASLQWVFERAELLSPMMLSSTSSAFAGCILVFAGLYQLTPLKEACLKHCRGPIQFLTQHWRPGLMGALRMGLHHGLYCLGCCWGLMAILFFGGIMNLYWIVGLALLVLVEKLAPLGHRVGKLLGVVLLAWGGWFLMAAATG